VLRTELVGRQHELDVLGECLDAALAGDPRLVVCRGEPGIGKTRLAEEMAVRATGEGVPAVWGRGVDADGAPPYWAWRQFLRATAEVVDVAGLADEHRLTADVSRLAPDVFPSTGQTTDHGSSEDRFRQFDAVGRLLRHIAARTPLVIILDDLHWADQPTLLLLQHVARTLTDERLLFVVNYRETELTHAAILANLLREPVTREMHLAGLPAPAVGRHLASVVGHDVSDDEAEEVYALTRGNPFFVGEIGRVLEDRRAGARSSLVTASVREAIGARLQRLSPECVRLLQAASIVGRDLPVALVSAVVGLPVAGCLGPLDEAYRHTGEDVDYCLAASRAGWRIRYVHDAEVWHHGGASTAQDPYRVTMDGVLSVDRYYRKNWSTTHARAYRLTIVVCRVPATVVGGLVAVATGRESLGALRSRCRLAWSMIRFVPYRSEAAPTTAE